MCFRNETRLRKPAKEEVICYCCATSCGPDSDGEVEVRTTTFTVILIITAYDECEMRAVKVEDVD